MDMKLGLKLLMGLNYWLDWPIGNLSIVICYCLVYLGLVRVNSLINHLFYKNLLNKNLCHNYFI